MEKEGGGEQPPVRYYVLFVHLVLWSLFRVHLTGETVSRGGSARWHQLPARCTDQ